MKKVFALILVSCMLLSFTGCGEVKNAEKAVNGMFTAFKNADLDEAQKYVNVDDTTNAENKSDENTAIILKAIFEKLDYEIISSEKIDDSLKEVWTLEEASKYSHIGINRMRELSASVKCPWVIWIGKTKRVVHKEKFIEWLKNNSIIDD